MNEMFSMDFFSTVPASSWEEALISGDGSLGALVSGDPARETITLSHERLLLPFYRPLPPVQTAIHLQQMRELLLAGRYQAAVELVEEQARQEGYGGLRWNDPPIPACDLQIVTGGIEETSDYARGTDFSTGIVQVNWATEHGNWRRRLFVSRADHVLVLALQPPPGHTLGCTLALVTTPSRNESEQRMFEEGIASVNISAENDLLSYRSHFRRQWPGSLRGYEGVARVNSRGGTISPERSGIVVREAEEILVLFGLALYTEEDEIEAAGAALRQRLRTLPADFASLLDRHRMIHSALFKRVRLDLGARGSSAQNTEDLLARAQQEQGALPTALIEHVFDAGRYAILSSCGAWPPALQGIWSGTWTPPWSGDYTHDGNLPIALASLLSAGMPELLHSYFDYLESLLADFRENARRLYGCRGIYLPSHTSAHGFQNHFNAIWCLTFWTAGAAWAAHYYYDYWQYTGDEEFLARRAVPFLEEVVDFYEDFLFSDEDGRLIFAPSYSPENTPTNSDSQACINATMDMALLKEVLQHLITASQTLQVRTERLSVWKSMLERLPAYRINSEGELAEWLWPDMLENHTHRHPSHLYPLLYEIDPEIAADPHLLQASQRALEARLHWWRSGELGSRDMAFGLVMLGLAAAHLRMKETAWEILGWLATRYWRPSLVSTHNPGSLFNVDICGGLPALLIEMLVQSRPGALDLLPVLPPEWATGRIEGICCRGGITIELLSWRPGQIQVTLRARQASQVLITFPSPLQTFRCPRLSAEAIQSRSENQMYLSLPAHSAVALEAALR
jgi:alpha-L-fucosidase 2